MSRLFLSFEKEETNTAKTVHVHVKWQGIYEGLVISLSQRAYIM